MQVEQDYYLNFRPMVAHIEGGGYGPMDAQGIPQVNYGPLGIRYNPAAVSEYALANYQLYLDTGDGGYFERFLRQSTWLAERLVTTPVGGALLYDIDYPKYGLTAPWMSALAQGQAISALLRAHASTGDEAFLTAARSAFVPLLHPVSAGGLQVLDAEGNLWLEEYPSPQPSCVLNGVVSCMFGLYDLAVIGDETAKELWDRSVETVAATLHHFDSGYWSRYDLLHRTMVSRHYHANLHVPQLEALHRLTGRPIFAEYATRWRSYLGSTRSSILVEVRRNFDRVERRLHQIFTRLHSRTGG